MEAAAKTELGAAIAKAEDGALVSGVNGIFEVLKKHGLLREVVIEPDYVGVHHMNRDGFGISVQDAHDLMSHILEIGWASEQCAPVACEVPPAEAEMHSTSTAGLRLCRAQCSRQSRNTI